MSLCNSQPDIAMGIPVANNDVATHDAATFLSASMPPGLTAGFVQSSHDFARRIWIVDNSGSMATGDGKRMVSGPDGRTATVTSSRWAELGDSLLWHAQLAGKMRAPTELRLLNPPGHGAQQVIEIGAPGGDARAETAAVERVIASGPTGRTPLCEQIRSVAQRIQAEAASLRATGQRVVVVIASDGAATDGDVAQAMKPLESLPVWIVVRLCTDSEDVVNYWNNIDAELELDMDVLDDLSGEAAEVVSSNGWLTYAASLHRLREWGCTNKVFDLLDEKALSVSEMHNLIQAVLGEAALDLPNPQLDWTSFEKQLSAILERTPLVWDPLQRRTRPWFTLSAIRKQYAATGLVDLQVCNGGSCSIM